MLFRRYQIVFAAVSLLFVLSTFAHSKDIVVIRDNQIITNNFYGFGAEWDSNNYAASDITDKDFQLITERIQKMRLPIVRIMMVGKYCYLGNGKFDWNSDSMKFIYKQLDFCQKQGMRVILCSWGAGRWMKMPDISGVDDPKYANVVGTFMDYLINTKGYSCIKYFSNVNEPDLELQNDWKLWNKSVANIESNFKRRGLIKKLILLGPETSQVKAENWLKNSSAQLPLLLGAYSMHFYASQSIVKAGDLESIILKNKQYVSSSNSVAASKPFFVTEAGMNDDARHPYGNPHIAEFEYGIFMADYAVQAARSGCSGVLAWMLDDTSLKDFYWGMWANKVNGFQTRKWYYSWSLLSRYFPTGSTIYRVDQPQNLRILVAKFRNSSKNTEDWSLCFVNRADNHRTVNISLPQTQNAYFNQYEYTDNPSTNTLDFSYKLVTRFKANLARDLVVDCQPNSVVIVTSLQT